MPGNESIGMTVLEERLPSFFTRKGYKITTDVGEFPVILNNAHTAGWIIAMRELPTSIEMTYFGRGKLMRKLEGEIKASDVKTKGVIFIKGKEGISCDLIEWLLYVIFDTQDMKNLKKINFYVYDTKPILFVAECQGFFFVLAPRVEV